MHAVSQKLRGELVIVQIRTRDDKGKYKDACAYDFAQAAIGQICNATGGFDGWVWLRGQLERYCLNRASEAHGNPTVADKWIQRYQALRGIG